MAPKKKAVDTKKRPSTKELDNAIKKKFGDSVSVGYLKSSKDVISTGSLALDIATGVGGVPRGRLFEIDGLFSAGKTYLTLQIAKNIQAIGGRVALIDTEFVADREYFESLGVDTSEDKLKIFYPENLETAGDLCVMLAESGLYNLIIFDSIAGAPYMAQQEGDLGDAHMMVRAKIMSTFMPKVNRPVWQNGVFMVFTNQLRMTPDKYNPYVAPGGVALPFHASVRVQIRSLVTPDDKPTDSEELDRVTIRGKIIKNKVAPPGREFEYVVSFSEASIDRLGEMASILTNPKYVRRLGLDRAGAWYTLPQGMIDLGFPEKINGGNKIYDFLYKALNEDGNIGLIQDTEKFIRKALIPSYDPDHVINLDSYDLDNTEFYEGEEEADA